MIVFTDKPLRRIVPRLPVGFGVDVDWLVAHNVTPIGTTQDADELFWDCEDTICFDPAKQVPVENVEGFAESVQSLKKLPESVLEAFRNQKDAGSTEIYFSTQKGRSLMITGYYYYGLILEQPVGEKKTLHEYGHIVDNIGIRGMESGYDYPPIWNLADEVNAIFDAKGDLITSYAKTNTFEDFAEHFCYYAWKGTTFRDRMAGNPDLQERYYFLRNQIFVGVEYEDPPPPPTTFLEGYVLDTEGKAVSDADIMIDFPPNLRRYRETLYHSIAKTDETGYFVLKGYPEGEYIFWAEKTGYERSEQVQLVLSVGVPVSISLTLTSIPTPRPAPWLVPILIVGSVATAAYLILKR